MKNNLKMLATLLLLIGATSSCGNTKPSESQIQSEHDPISEESEPSVNPSVSEEPLPSEEPSEEPSTPVGEYVENYDLDAERKFTGYLVDGFPEGEGVLTWHLTNCVYTGHFHDGLYQGQGKFEWRNDGNVFVGEFRNNEPYYGKFTYANTMSYEGYMKNWTFDGQGKFDWNQYFSDGTVKSYGWLYEGEFKNGTIAGCYGKVTFDQTLKNVGVIWYVGLMDGFPSVAKNQNGKAAIRYEDKSVYTGDVYYGFDGIYKRMGHGEMDFTQCNFAAENAGGPAGSYINKYVGEFNHDVTGWMYGNGVMYFGNASGEITSYIEGFWGSYTRTADWEGTFNPETDLIEGCKDLPRAEYLPYNSSVQAYLEKYKDKTSTNILFLGDSYIDMWQDKFNIAGNYSYEKLTKDMDTVNIGIGGTTSGQWNESLFDKLTSKLSSANHVVLHIGLNDVNNGLSVEKTLTSIGRFVEKIEAKYPSAKVYIFNAQPSPNFAHNWQKIKAVGEGINSLCAKDSNLVLLDSLNLFFTGNDSIPYNPDYYSDGVHLNEAGYHLWTDLLFDALNS